MPSPIPLSDAGTRRRAALLQAAVVFGAALAVRAAYLLSIRHAFFFDHLQTEPQRYDEWAAAILRGAAPASPPLDEAPAYPYLVALLYAAFGRGPAVVAAAQALLDAASAAALAWTGRRYGGARTGWLTGALAALYGPLVYFTGQIEPATLAVFAVSVALAATPADGPGPGPGGDGDNGRARWVLAGGAWGAAVLVRSELVLALPSLLLHALFAPSGGRGAAARAAVVPALLLAGSLTVNAISSHHLVLLTTGSGANLWIGNNPQADGVNPFIHGPMAAVTAEVEASATDAVAADTAFRRHALDFVHRQPGAALRLLLKKSLWVWTARELPNAADIDWQTSQSWLFHPPVFPLGFGGVLPLAAAGAVLLGRRWRRCLVLTGPLAVAVVTSVVFFTNARFRLVMVPALLVLAGHALDRGGALLRAWRQHRRELTWAALALAACLGISWGNFYGVRSYAIPQVAVNTAALEHGAGDLAGAVRHLQQGLRGDPQDAAAWVQLGLTLEEAGRLDEAREAWLGALQHLPGDPRIRKQAALHLRRLGPR